MSLQYISDNKGETTGVFIPIQEWNNLKKHYNISEADVYLTPALKQELNKRIDHYLENPKELNDWEEVKTRI